MPFLTSLLQRLGWRLFRYFLHVASLLLRLAQGVSRRPWMLRSLWAGTPILTLPVKARAESLLGVQAETLVHRPYFITDAFTYNLQHILKWPHWRRALTYLAVFTWACLRYQRFHFFCDRGLLPPAGHQQFNEMELCLLRSLGKEIFCWTYGADVRTRERTLALGEPNCCTECPSPGQACICDEEAGRRNYQRLQRYATAIFSLGDMIEYTPGSRNDLYFWPLDLDADAGQRYRPCYPDPTSTAPIRVVHAPNHRGFKGTRYIIEAVQQLQAEGVPIELQLVEGVPNRQALEIYRTADIVFDQCLIGFHGYFALEALAMGKPVMVYIRDPQRYLLHPEECPLINARADQVLEVLRELVRDRQRLYELGVQGRRYIEKYFTVAAFAERLRRAYHDLGVARAA